MQAVVAKASMTATRNYIMQTGPLGFNIVQIMFSNDRGLQQVSIVN
jgi:hypothetical protein